MGRRMRLNESQLRGIVRALLGEQSLSGPDLGVDFVEPKENKVVASDDEGVLVAEGWDDPEGHEEESEFEDDEWADNDRRELEDLKNYNPDDEAARYYER